jgi:hypothetical protein
MKWIYWMRLEIKSLLLLCAGISILSLSGCGNSATTGTLPTSAVHSEWTWVSGSNAAVTVSSVYGSKGVAAPENNPNGDGVSWIDSSGNLWLFGGGGFDPLGTLGPQNDLWEYSPESKEWTWVGGCGSVPLELTELKEQPQQATLRVAALERFLGLIQVATFGFWVDQVTIRPELMVYSMTSGAIRRSRNRCNTTALRLPS